MSRFRTLLCIFLNCGLLIWVNIYERNVSIVYKTATEIMIKDFEIKLQKSMLSLSWKTPEYLPTHYVLKYSLIQESSGLVYTDSERLITMLANSFIIEDVWLGSLGKLNLKAVYNPAALDEGITKFIGPADTAGKCIN